MVSKLVIFEGLSVWFVAGDSDRRDGWLDQL